MLRAVVVGFALMVATDARAEDAWAKGVSAENQKRANELFAEANQLFAQQAHAPALEKYREATALWNHPVIQFNMAVTLVRLDRHLEAADAIEAALKFGESPFSSELYGQVLDYQKLVQGRVGDIEATCSTKGASVTLDGKPWFPCPGSRKVRVLSGEHGVSAEHPTMISRPQRIRVIGGELSTVTVDPVSVDDAFTYERRFPTWAPWIVMGAGSLGFAFGVLLEIDAANQLNQYEQDVAASCSVNGCTLNPGPDAAPAEIELANRLRDQRDRAFSREKLALVTLGIGTAAIVTGVVMVILNRPQRKPVVNAGVSADGASASVSWSF